MGFRPSYRRKRFSTSSTNLNITPFIDILICLILFLLVTAMYGKAAILNLYLPTEGAPPETENAQIEKTIIPTVAVTRNGFIVNMGRPGTSEVVRIPMKDRELDYAKLHDILMNLRRDPEASNNIVILSEADLKYQSLVSTMDACREYLDASGRMAPLFPVISVGEYRAAAAPEGQGT